jgi:hypothetical protein
MTDKNKRFLVAFLLGFIISCISAHFLKTIVTKFFDDMSSGNIDLRNVSDPSESELKNAVLRYNNGEITVIDLSTITAFSWDRLYMFGDYTEPSEIDSVVGRSWRENCYTSISTSEATLLVFTSNGIVIHCIDYVDGNGDFLIPKEAYQGGISSQEALFVVNDHKRIIWIGNKDQ